MGIIRTILGPKSKYVDELPFTYEARVLVVEDLEITNTIVSDTICRLVEHLLEKGIDPKQVEIREVYPDREELIDQALYTNASCAGPSRNTTLAMLKKGTALFVTVPVR